ncbi:hypothetical protein CW304_12360 [Bacillus sp. UFRGS-B20]|nr:hypothetical protein CW304_12360 [Bacillus sp. UFRGS-B20]
MFGIVVALYFFTVLDVNPWFFHDSGHCFFARFVSCFALIRMYTLGLHINNADSRKIQCYFCVIFFFLYLSGTFRVIFPFVISASVIHLELAHSSTTLYVKRFDG